ncbi:hypothetical protein BpHYR1_004091 [Brachionus plicatilis]|uniref:Uncharacterized protein n=1 Tax=Brachionus plicatilis TaxID=10195 RepID=A0A3M7RVL6_BRAPC|nr:hypothetical protein BpHYR1_004091 [Brachionus plicatilis]
MKKYLIFFLARNEGKRLFLRHKNEFFFHTNYKLKENFKEIIILKEKIYKLNVHQIKISLRD